MVSGVPGRTSLLMSPALAADDLNLCSRDDYSPGLLALTSTQCDSLIDGSLDTSATGGDMQFQMYELYVGVHLCSQHTTIIAQPPSQAAPSALSQASLACCYLLPSLHYCLPSSFNIGPSTASYNPGTSSYNPGTSSLNPGTSSLNPGTSSLNPGTSSLNPGTSSLNPGTSSLNPPQAPVSSYSPTLSSGRTYRTTSQKLKGSTGRWCHSSTRV